MWISLKTLSSSCFFKIENIIYTYCKFITKPTGLVSTSAANFEPIPNLRMSWERRVFGGRAGYQGDLRSGLTFVVHSELRNNREGVRAQQYHSSKDEPRQTMPLNKPNRSINRLFGRQSRWPICKFTEEKITYTQKETGKRNHTWLWCLRSNMWNSSHRKRGTDTDDGKEFHFLKNKNTLLLKMSKTELYAVDSKLAKFDESHLYGILCYNVRVYFILDASCWRLCFLVSGLHITKGFTR